MKIDLAATYSFIAIPVDSTLQLSSEKRILLLESNGKLLISTVGNSQIQYENTSFMGKGSFSILNIDNDTVFIRAVVFSTGTEESIPIDHFLIFEKEDRILLSNLIDKCISNIDKHVIDCSNREESFFRSLYTTMQLSHKKIDFRLVYIHRYINDHYFEVITLNFLAELIGFNPVYLSNTYKKFFNLSPIQYLQLVRMREACNLLINTTLSIAEIASKVGYVSNSQFSMTFKKHFGKTPMEYRNISLLQRNMINNRSLKGGV
ncbi:helix-turn-helix domain-containing protein [Bacillales bacterium AN1005]